VKLTETGTIKSNAARARAYIDAKQPQKPARPATRYPYAAPALACLGMTRNTGTSS
jgi:hypothetical protein